MVCRACRNGYGCGDASRNEPGLKNVCPFLAVFHINGVSLQQRFLSHHKSMKQPKFIITDSGYFRFGMVSLHKHLLRSGEVCMGGGFYEFDTVSMRMILTGRSYDFGPPCWNAFDRLKVPSGCRGMRIIYVPDNPAEDDFVVTDRLDIEYV